MITFTDVFCGAGGSSIGLVAAGFQLQLAANHWDRAIETHSANFRDADHLCADVSNYDMRRLPSTDVLWASPECFTAGHLVTTARGQVPIEQVQIGDLVLTHRRRWRPVVRVQSRIADTIMVAGQGHPGIETTANHSFWARDSRQVWDSARHDYVRRYAEPDWTRADELVGRTALWATPTSTAPLPDVSGPPAAFGLDLDAAWWLVGRWIGDGSLGRGHDAGAVILTCGAHEAAGLRERLADTGATWAERRLRTAVSFRLGDVKARAWLAEQCGVGAADKQLPAFALSLPRAGRRALLDGYLSADGHRRARDTSAATVSKALAVSVRLLAESLGHRVGLGRDRRTTWSIEGRCGLARSQWTLRWTNDPAQRRAPEAVEEFGFAWSRVRRTSPGRTARTVYNIEVAEDHSYVLDGITVRNCTWHSPSGGRKRPRAQTELFGESLPEAAGVRSRATMYDVIRAAEVHRYRYVIVENVVEVADWTMFDWWFTGMINLGYTGQVVCVNSAHVGDADNPHAPQWRDRIYIVFTRDGMPIPDLELRPAAWCFECDREVHARQVFKPRGKRYGPDRQYRVGKYRSQYVYRCPNSVCRFAEVEPYVLPASTAIDWTDLGKRIGERSRPLAEATIRRIRLGLAMFAQGSGQPVMLNVNHQGDNGRPYPAAAAPLPPRTTKIGDGFATAEPFITMLRANGGAMKIGHPLATIAAGGNHHGLTIPPGADLSRIDNSMVIPYRRGAKPHHPDAQPFSTVATIEQHALLDVAGTVADCMFRMVSPREHLNAQRFPSSYIVIGTKGEQTMQAGNAVSSNVAQWIGTRIALVLAA